jgi:hypothetical protein
MIDSRYAPKTDVHCADLPGMVSLSVVELFPSIRPGFLQKEGIAEVRRATEKALADADMTMIKPGDSVNILSAEHGYYLLGGDHYCEMVKTIRDVVREKTGCSDIRLRVAGGMHTKEADDIIDHFDLRIAFDGKVAGTHAFDRGIPIETEIGTLYGLARIYDADWVIHASHDEQRDLYFYRMIDRVLKAFVMSYARYEVRSLFHSNFGSRSANFIQRSIFNSDFVQKRFVLGCFLRMTPAGITGVDADKDLDRLGRKISVDLMRDYGKVLKLFSEIDECVVVLDGPRWAHYLHAGGVVFGCFENSIYDAYDLSNHASIGYFDLLSKIATGDEASMQNIMLAHPGIKAAVVNQSMPGIPWSDIAIMRPTFVANASQASSLRRDPANASFMDIAEETSTLEEALERACEAAGTDKVIAFDDSFGYITCSPSMSELLKKLAPEVSRKVDTEYLPKWLSQRGLDNNPV